MKRQILAVALGTLLCTSAFPVATPAQQPQRIFSTDSFARANYSMHWRPIGPLRGGRTKNIQGVAQFPNRFYIAAVNGGIWRSDDAGETWRPIFDAQDTQSIGALAVAPSDPNVIYAGSGEGLQRPDLSVGNGMYKSNDAGATWTHLGLRDAQQISHIAVDPKNPQRLFVAALGHPYGPNEERGIYRSTDGGATFQRVLYKDVNTGAYDVQIDPNHPDTVYATLWAARQAPWEIGGSFEIPHSGIYKSTDGGSTWKQLTSGLPSVIGRAEVAVAPSNSSVIYAYTDTPDKGGIVSRSDDAGAHFAQLNNDDRIAERGDDLVALAVDPKNAQELYLTNTSTYRTTDGGKTFTAIKGAPGGDDYQNVWINPNNSDIVALASDQGATISVDGGQTWSSWYNQPTAQMYHVMADDRFPYWVCGGQQESGSACVKSRGDWGEITTRDWHPVGAEEYGYVAPDPLHPGVFYGGKVERYDEATGQVQEVAPSYLRGNGYRVVRTEPLIFNPIDKHELFFGANRVYSTRDGGMHWNAISPDLTRSAPEIPGVITAFESGDPQHGKHRGVVYAIAPSFTHNGTIWAGTDDGQVWRVAKGGTWKNITPPGLTSWSKISQIDASHFDDATAYIAVNRIRLDDMKPHVYVTHDAGAHWSQIVNGLPDAPVNAVRADPTVRGLLYAGTETGVWTSHNDGASWESLTLDLPHTSVRDLIVKNDDLVVATHGRGFYILDDITPLRQFAQRPQGNELRLLVPQTALRVRRSLGTDTPLPPEIPAGENPPDGAIVDYVLPDGATSVTISFYDAQKHLLRRYSSNDTAPAAYPFDKPSYWERPFVKPVAGGGLHRFVWDLRETPPQSLGPDMPISAVDADTPRVPQGALVPPGRYTVVVSDGTSSVSQPLTVTMDPRVHMSTRELNAQYAMAHNLAALLNRTFDAAAKAQGAKDAKLQALFGDLHGRVQVLYDVIDGVDAPATSQAHTEYCSLTTQTLKALGSTERGCP